MRTHRGLLLFAVLAMAASAMAQPTAVLDTMSQELNRNFTILKQKADPAPYFLSYEIAEQEWHIITAGLGAIASDNSGKARNLDVSVRVGTPKLDNYHRAGGERGSFTSGRSVAVDDHVDSIKLQLWGETNRAYSAAADRLIRIKTSNQVKAAREDQSGDFSTEEPSVFEKQPPAFRFDQQAWTARVRKLSERFWQYPEVLGSHVTVDCRRDAHYFVNTEGSRILHGRGFARIMLSASSRAEDGTDLNTYESFDALDETGLPNDETIVATIDRIAKDLLGLLRAPETEPYVGPAILSGRAAGVFFHEIFGHRIEGERQKDETEGQTFTKSVGSQVLPDFLSVVFDPTRQRFGDVTLNGWYEYDNEGIKTRSLTAVEGGVLKAFLMSRSPIQGFDHSNGHGRRQTGREVVSRQSNLIVESSRAVSDARLREMLIEEVKHRGKPYGLYFRDITSGFTMTRRGSVQAFKVNPVIVYRVYPDGRPDELIRGADIVGTPLASFAKILAVADKPDVFNGYCGAESGSVPVSAISPAILVSEIEVEKKAKSNDRPPLLPPPGDGPSRGGPK